MELVIREATEQDIDQVWNIFSKVIAAGDAFVFDPSTPFKDFKKYWFAEHMKTYVAEEGSNIIGSYYIKPNQPGLGSHIANAGYMVDPSQRGKGIGTKMCEHSILQARNLQYRGMQFNIVVSTNSSALKIWKQFGFQIIGTTPGAFRHANLGYVDTHIMFKSLV